MKKVSIIIPVYNAEEYIERCIVSVVNQTYKNIELILFDDGSIDSSLEIMRKWETYDFIKVYSRENKGVAITRNESLCQATGYYIMYIDNDDYIDCDYVEQFVNEIERTSADIVIGGYKRVNINGEIMFKYSPQNDKWQKYTVVTPWAKIYKKDVLMKYSAEFLNYGIGEDVYFSLNLYSRDIKITCFKYNGYNWFFNTKSVSNTSHRGFNKKIDITFLADRLLDFNCDSNKEKEYLFYYIYKTFVWYLLFSGRNADNLSFMKEYHKMWEWYKIKVNKKVRIPKTEKFKVKCIVIFMNIIFKFHLTKLFSKCYCKGTVTAERVV